MKQLKEALRTWRWMREKNMINRHFALLAARLLWLKLRYGKRFQTEGMCFVCPRVKFEIGPDPFALQVSGAPASGIAVVVTPVE